MQATYAVCNPSDASIIVSASTVYAASHALSTSRVSSAPSPLLKVDERMTHGGVIRFEPHGEASLGQLGAWPLFVAVGDSQG